MLRCEECGAATEDAPGWIAVPAQDPDDRRREQAVIVYCPDCAWREFGGDDAQVG